MSKSRTTADTCRNCHTQCTQNFPPLGRQRNLIAGSRAFPNGPCSLGNLSVVRPEVFRERHLKPTCGIYGDLALFNRDCHGAGDQRDPKGKARSLGKWEPGWSKFRLMSERFSLCTTPVTNDQPDKIPTFADKFSVCSGPMVDAD